MVFDESDLLVVEASDEARRLVRVVGTRVPRVRGGVGTRRPTDRENQLRKHPVDVRWMVLGLGPEDRRVREERQLARVAAFRQHAEVYVADDAGAVVPAEEFGRDLVLQLFLSYGWYLLHAPYIIAFFTIFRLLPAALSDG